jgi:large subunit ribosomal protein L15
MPLYRRIPKRGFNNAIFRRVFTIINVGELESGFADGATIDLAGVVKAGLVSKEKRTDLFKVLGNGELKKRFVVKADAVSASAKAKIEAAGGTVELIPEATHRPKFVRKGETTPRAPSRKS